MEWPELDQQFELSYDEAADSSDYQPQNLKASSILDGIENYSSWRNLVDQQEFVLVGGISTTA